MSVEASVGAGAEGGALELTDRSGSPRRGRRTASRMLVWRQSAVVATVPLLTLVLCVVAARTIDLVPQSIRPLNTVGMGGIFNLISFRLLTFEVLPIIGLLPVVYLIAVGYSDRVSRRTLIWSVAIVTVAATLAPPLFSTDMFSYEAYARMFVIYHVNPYTHGPFAISLDPVYQFIGASWIQTPTDYGPLFTLLTGPMAWLSVPISELTFKLVGGLCIVGTLWLVWKSAALRGVSQTRALALVGLNPLVIISGVGGGHNDSLMLWFMVAGVYAVLVGRDRPAGALMATSMAIKLTGGVVMPFAVLSDLGSRTPERRKRLIAGIAAASMLSLVASMVFFGFGAFQMFNTLSITQAEGSWQSVPGFFFTIFLGYTPLAARYGLDVVTLGIILWLMWRVWTQRLDWIEAAAWASLTVLATAWTLLPWYMMLTMPLVALSKDHRLWKAAAIMTLIGGIILVGESVPGGVSIFRI
ncbi:MAG: polyprenol phosphomannose-dependent alpha 1,6 mannosyltransferase MptB [Solirubrobacteraceae bacterium]